MSITSIDNVKVAFATAAPHLTNHWRTILRKLGVTESQIQEVVSEHRQKRPDEVVYQGLCKWQEVFRDNATIGELINVLQSMGLKECADLLRKYQVKLPGELWVPRENAELTRSQRQKLPEREVESSFPDWETNFSSNWPSPSDRNQTSRRDIPISRRDPLFSTVTRPLAPLGYYPRESIEVPVERIRGNFGSIVPQPRTRESSVRPAPSESAPPGQLHELPPLLSYSRIGTPQTIKTYADIEPEEIKSPDQGFQYNYIASLVSPSKIFKREPRYRGICFSSENDIVLLDNANSQVEIHECKRIFDGKRFAFRKVFKVPLGKYSKLSSVVIYENIIIILDTGEKCLRFLTTDGHQAGMVKFHRHPKCIAIRDNRAAIAFWSPNIKKGSIVTYRVNISTDRKGAKKFSMFLPNNVVGVSNNYSDIALTDKQEIVALSEEGRIYLFGFQSPLSATYVCHSVADSAGLRCVRCSKDGAIVCNSFRDALTFIPIVGGDVRKFDTENSRSILSDEDGINGVNTFAVFDADNEIAVVNNFGNQIHMYGIRMTVLRD